MMDINGTRSTRGQVLLMVTLSLIAMFGLMGLAVDLGWSHYLKRSAQAAADAGALAAAHRALTAVGQLNDFNCGTNVTCQADPGGACDMGGNLLAACQYTSNNGFVHGANGGRQSVRVGAGTSTPPPTVPDVPVLYWVTVRAAETTPQLFSSVLGITDGTSAARATAAISDVVLASSLWALNRANDPGPSGAGISLQGAGTPGISAPQGIVVASNAAPASDLRGTATVTGPTSVLDGGSVQWSYQNAPDGPQFLDPFRGKGQPPLPATALPSFPIPGGNIAPGSTLPPGNYFATGPQPGCRRNCPTVATGEPIRISGAVTFSGGTFGDYFFYGGLVAGNGSTMNIGPGRYVMVGSLRGGEVFDIGNGVTIQETAPNGAGSAFIFTGTDNTGAFTYPGMMTQVSSDSMLAANYQQFHFGNSSLVAGDGQTIIRFSGLNPASADLPSNLRPFGGIAIWQDQANSLVKYTPDGNIDFTSCGPGHTIDNPCLNTLLRPDSPDMHFQANANMQLNGIIYQPRGAWMSTQGGPGSGVIGNLSIITGAITMGGAGNINLPGSPVPITNRVVSLIE